MQKKNRRLLTFLLAALCGLSGYASSETVHACDTITQTCSAEGVQLTEPTYPTLNPDSHNTSDADDIFLNTNARIRAIDIPDASTKLITSLSSSELSTPQNWNLSIKNQKLIVTLYDEQAVDGIYTLVNIVDQEGNQLADQWGIMNKHSSTLELNLAPLSKSCANVVRVRLWEGSADSDSVSWLTDYYLQYTDNAFSFVDTGFGEHETAFIKQLNEEYDPSDYDHVPYKYYPGSGSLYAVENLEEITAKAAELTKGLTTDEEKVKVIHDWLCTNFAYDMEAYYSTCIIDAANPTWVYKNKRAVCSGFSRLCQIMLTSLNIPCINIAGYAEGYGLSADQNYEGTNHEWNVVYLNGSWRSLDVTWDCTNKYWGNSSNEPSTIGNAPQYIYYGIPAQDFGSTHISKKTYANNDGYVSFVKLLSVTTTEFEVGDKFICDAVLGFSLSNSDQDELKRFFMSFLTTSLCSGYDMNKEGRQTVTISLFGQKLSYDIVVGQDSSAEHTLGEWTVIKEADCTHDGLKQRTCTDCGEVIVEEIIPATGHSGGTATCKTKAVCSSCGESYGEYTDHVYSTDWTIDLSPTCEDNGSKSHHCIICGAQEEITTISATGHTSSDWIIDEQTSSTLVKRHKECTTCHTILETEVSSINPSKSDSSDQTVTSEKLPIVSTTEQLTTEKLSNTEQKTTVQPSSTEKATTESKTEEELKKGSVVEIGTSVYKVTSTDSAKRTVTYVKPSTKGKNATRISIPSTVKISGTTYKVTAIADKALQNNKKVKTIVIGNNILNIGKNAFNGCKNLTSVTIKTKLLSGKTIGKSAFKGISAKAKITVPKAKKTAYKKLLKQKGISAKATIK